MSQSDFVQNRIKRIMTDPSLDEAEEFCKSLMKRGLAVYFNPKYGVVIVGMTKGIKASKDDLDTAWILRHEIGLLFGIGSFSAHAAAEKEAERVISLQ